MDVFAAIADPTRRALLRRLAHGEARVVDLAADHEVSRPAISRHLRVLGEASVVAVADHGRERHYRLDPRGLAAVRDFLDELAGIDRGDPVPAPPIHDHHLDALETEARRAARDRRAGHQHRLHDQPHDDQEHIA